MQSRRHSGVPTPRRRTGRRATSIRSAAHGGSSPSSGWGRSPTGRRGISRTSWPTSGAPADRGPPAPARALPGLHDRSRRRRGEPAGDARAPPQARRRADPDRSRRRHHLPRSRPARRLPDRRAARPARSAPIRPHARGRADRHGRVVRRRRSRLKATPASGSRAAEARRDRRAGQARRHHPRPRAQRERSTCAGSTR